MSPSILLLLALGQFAAPPLARPGGEVEVHADSAELEDRDLHVEGNVTFRSGGLLLRTGEADYDLDTREGTAGGGLLLIDGGVVLRAREGTFSLGTGTLAVDDAVLVEKAVLISEERYSLEFDELRKRGKNTLVLRAEHLERLASRRFIAEHVRMTPCDCGRTTPDWEIATSHADIELGERAIISWPVVYVYGVPVLALPALYLPLSSRRTGLLFPRFGSNGNSGFYLDEPLFITLGESYDTTLTGGYFFGGQKKPGIRGPRLLGEFRYAPAESTAGRLQLNTYDDHNPDVVGGAARGWRGSFQWRHGTTTATRLELQTDVDLASDTRVLADTVPYIPAPYTLSRARAALRFDDSVLELGSSYYQPLAVYDSATGMQRSERFLLLHGPGAPIAVQRPIVARFDVPSADVGGGLRLGVGATATTLAPLPLRNEAVPPTLDAPGTLSRIDVIPRISRPLSSGVITSEVYAGGQLDAVAASTPAGNVTSASTGQAVWGRAFVGAEAGTVLIRSLGPEPTKALRHTLEPRLELRAVSPSWNQPREAPFTVHDEFDAGYAPRLQLQTVAALTTRLIRASGEDIARLVVGQDAELRSQKLGDSFAEVAASAGFVSGSVGARYDSRHRVAPLIAASTWLSDGRGDSLGVSYVQSHSVTGTDRTRSGILDLFQVLDPGYQSTRVTDQLNLQAAARPFTWLTLQYNSQLNPTGSERGLRKFLIHSAGVGLTSSCDCWNVNVVASVARYTQWTPSFSFLLDLKSFGTIGSR